MIGAILAKATFLSEKAVLKYGAMPLYGIQPPQPPTTISFWILNNILLVVIAFISLFLGLLIILFKGKKK